MELMLLRQEFFRSFRFDRMPLDQTGTIACFLRIRQITLHSPITILEASRVYLRDLFHPSRDEACFQTSNFPLQISARSRRKLCEV